MSIEHEMAQMQLESFCDNCFLDAALSFNIANTIVVSTFFNLAISFPHFPLQLHFTLGTNQYYEVVVASVICFQKMYGLHGVNHQTLQYSEKEKVITDKQTDTHTDRQTEFPI